ncbi:Isoprenylcysteine carboxyl methyltransferase family-domain-containing protein [Dactylonectria estremocensis]|uniref:Protein-S-isoprenylcysteine O-methyltransferase n=1 Tax=Dactylonectria estremocensis TaxID=1079267 RepID=A0A9P9FIL4_9HYPO|nr:Isoprenylcysteine carboxyl methyltransferase family-domain-containing protein [Dactylonectria estremocensis]
MADSDRNIGYASSHVSAQRVNFNPMPAHHGASLSTPYDLSSDDSDAPALVSTDLHLMKPFFSGQPKSLSGIALRAFCLGIALATSGIAMLGILVFTSSPIWRVPFFLFALSIFHFLEFWCTAERNTLVAKIDSFLLTANWPSYAIAHSAAFLECGVVSVFFPNRRWAPFGLSPWILALGLFLTVIGQIVRSVAMFQAGASFNHMVQTRKADSHRLVKTGIYAVFRHPSYFGFFYWGLGSQLVLGNVICFVGYTAVLWLFFSRRIRHEEAKLIEFFKDDYVQYRKNVGTKMPLIG